MSNLTFLQVAIGLVFLYFLLSLICTAVNEWIAKLLSLRAANLAEGIKNLLNDKEGKDLAKQLYAHGLIQGITPPQTKDVREKGAEKTNKALDGKNGPAYIPSETFAAALLDISQVLIPDDTTKSAKERTDAQLAAINNVPAISGTTKVALEALIKQANGDLAVLQKSVANWFDGAMDRVSGWYKRKMNLIIIIPAILVTLALNADTLFVVQTLSRDEGMRAAFVKQAQDIAGKDQSTSPTVLLKSLEGVPLPIGWGVTTDGQNPGERFKNNPGGVVLGWLLTAAALSMGAPFWFDLLNKLVNVRLTGDPPPKASKP